MAAIYVVYVVCYVTRHLCRAKMSERAPLTRAAPDFAMPHDDIAAVMIAPLLMFRFRAIVYL